MATYVNLNVNQGLINKAKQVQGANRNSLANKQAAKKKKAANDAKDGPARKQDRFKRRKPAGITSDGLDIGFFISRMYVSGNITMKEWMSGDGGFKSEAPDTRRYRVFSSADGLSTVADPGSPETTTNPWPDRSTNEYATTWLLGTRQLVLPVDSQSAIVVARNFGQFSSTKRPPPFGNPIETIVAQDTFFGAVISSTAIRRISVPLNVQALLGGAGQVGRFYGVIQPEIKYAPEVTVVSLALNSTTADIYAGINGSIQDDRALCPTFIGWDTADGLPTAPGNTLLLHEFPGFDPTATGYDRSQKISLQLEHPEPRYNAELNIATFPASEGRQIITARGYDEDPVQPTFISQYIPPPYDEGNPGNIGRFIEYPEDQTQYSMFWDWGVPEYCQQQLLALGFSPADFSP